MTEARLVAAVGWVLTARGHKGVVYVSGNVPCVGLGGVYVDIGKSSIILYI